MAYQRHKRKINAIVNNIIEGTSSSDVNEWNDNVDNEVHVDGHNIGDVLDADASDASNEDHLEQVVSSSESDEDVLVNHNPEAVENAPPELNDDIAAWAIKNKITRTALTELLGTLKAHRHAELPKDGHTLLKTPRAINTIDRCRDKYCYFGLEHGILSIIEHNLPFPYDTIEVKINIDGVPLFKSTNTQFWPILCQIKTYAPFLVGLFCGKVNPII